MNKKHKSRACKRRKTNPREDAQEDGEGKGWVEQEDIEGEEPFSSSSSSLPLLSTQSTTNMSLDDLVFTEQDKLNPQECRVVCELGSFIKQLQERTQRLRRNLEHLKGEFATCVRSQFCPEYQRQHKTNNNNNTDNINNNNINNNRNRYRTRRNNNCVNKIVELNSEDEEEPPPLPLPPEKDKNDEEGEEEGESKIK